MANRHGIIRVTMFIDVELAEKGLSCLTGLNSRTDSVAFREKRNSSDVQIPSSTFGKLTKPNDSLNREKILLVWRTFKETRPRTATTTRRNSKSIRLNLTFSRCSNEIFLLTNERNASTVCPTANFLPARRERSTDFRRTFVRRVSNGFVDASNSSFSHRLVAFDESTTLFQVDRRRETSDSRRTSSWNRQVQRRAPKEAPRRRETSRTRSRSRNQVGLCLSLFLSDRCSLVEV